jgi:hypothetical protein
MMGFRPSGDVACSCQDVDGDGFSINGGLCGPVDCSDGDPMVNPSAAELCDLLDNDCDGELNEGCQPAEGASAVDIIFAVDNSASMTNVLSTLERSLTLVFSQTLDAAGIDYKVIMVTDHGLGSVDLCVGPPLSGTTDCSRPAVGTARFDHYDVNVQSLDALCVLLDTFDGSRGDQSGLFPGGWQALARPDAMKVFVVVTDDGTWCTTLAGESLIDGGTDLSAARQAAADFDAALVGRSPAQFGTAAARRYTFYDVIGIAAKADPAAAYSPAEPVTPSRCSTAVNPGTAYQWLATNTNGLRFPVCELGSFDVILQSIAADIVRRFR